MPPPYPPAASLGTEGHPNSGLMQVVIEWIHTQDPYHSHSTPLPPQHNNCEVSNKPSNKRLWPWLMISVTLQAQNIVLRGLSAPIHLEISCIRCSSLRCTAVEVEIENYPIIYRWNHHIPLLDVRCGLPVWIQYRTVRYMVGICHHNVATCNVFSCKHKDIISIFTVYVTRGITVVEDTVRYM